MIQDITNIVLSIGIFDIVDILIVAFLAYKLIGFIRESRAQQLVRGIAVLVLVFLLSQILNLNLLNWLLRSLLTIGLIAVIVIFQPELRKALERIGRRGIITNQFKNVSKEDAFAVVHKIIDSVDDFSSTRTGALIAIERETNLNDIVETGVVVDAEISVRLLGNLFYEGSPLHDGAVIIRGTRIHAASCVLPLTSRTDIGGNLGTRHRAGVGLGEVSDALVIIVSEESGAISVAQNGEFKRFVDLKRLEKILLDIYLGNEEDNKEHVVNRILGGGK